MANEDRSAPEIVSTPQTAGAAPSSPETGIADSAASQLAVDPNTSSAPAVATSTAEGVSDAKATGADGGNEAAVAPAELAKPAEAVPAEAKPDEKPKAADVPKPAPSLLAEADKKPEADAPKAEAETAPDDGAAAELPKFTAYDLPEGIKLEPGKLDEFNGVLGRLELAAKTADHNAYQAAGQELVDMHVAAMTALREAVTHQQHQTWVDTRRDWQQQVREHPVLGRNRFETVMRDAARIRDMFATDSFREMIEYTGAGDHPGMLEFVNNIARFLDRRGLLREGTPVAAPPARTATKSGPRSRYNGNTGA